MATAMQPGLPDIFAGFNADADRRRKIVVCARELRKLAARRRAETPSGQPDFGVTAEDTRRIAIRYGYATGAEEKLRALSWFAAVPKVARLTPTDRTRTNAQRNAHRVHTI